MVTTSGTGSGVPAYAGNGAGCPLSNDQNHTSDHVTQYHCPLPNPTIAGNLLVLSLRYNTPTQVPTFTDNVGGNSYQQAVTCTDSTNGVVTGIYYVSGVKAGVNTVTVHLTSTQFVQLQPYEFFDAGTLDQAVCASNVSSSSVFTPAFATFGAVGDLIFHYGQVTNQVQIGACTKGSQSNIAWNLRESMVSDRFGSCMQWGVYQATAAFSPTLSVNTSISYLSAAAAFKPQVSGSAPPSGIRVVYLQHDNTDNEQDASRTLQVPMTGNTLAVLFNSGCLDPSITDCAYPTAVTDGVNTWAQIGGTIISPASDGGAASANVWYAKGVAAGTYSQNWTMHPRSSGGNGSTWYEFDISGASGSAPLDTTLGLASATGDQATGGGGGNLTTLSATPTNPNEVMLTQVGWGWNSPLGMPSPAGGQFLAAGYLTESNPTHCDLNSGAGLFYNGGSTASQTFTWSQDHSNFAGVGDWVSTVVAFH